MFRIKKKSERALSSSPRSIDVGKLGSAKQSEYEARRRAQEVAEEVGHVAPAASSIAATTRPEQYRLRLDSGSSMHMNSFGGPPRQQKKLLRKTKEPILLSTANGLLAVDREFDFEVPRLSTTVTALYIPDSPAVLSIGKLVKENGFVMYWIPGYDPYFIGPDNTVYWLQEERNCPSLYANSSTSTLIEPPCRCRMLPTPGEQRGLRRRPSGCDPEAAEDGALARM